MSKQSTIQRAAKRLALSIKQKAKRDALRASAKDTGATSAQRDAARRALEAMPRDSSPVRVVARCAATGRSGSVFKRFGLGRSALRDYAMKGLIPGLAKASW